MNVSVLGNVFCRQFLKNRQFQAKSNEINQINYKNIWLLKVIMILIMTAQVLYFNDFCEKDPTLMPLSDFYIEYLTFHTWWEIVIMQTNFHVTALNE